MKSHSLFLAPFVLLPGAILKFVPTFPPNYKTAGKFSVSSESLPYLELMEKYHGQRAEFVDYDSYLVGVLDYRGLMPGTYRNRGLMLLKFDDGGQHLISAKDVVVLPGLYVRHQHLADEEQELERVGDLPHPILFYPGDKVWVKGQADFFPDDQHEVRSVFVGNEMFAPGGIPRYEVMETDGEQTARVREEDRKNIRKPPGQRVMRHYYVDRMGRNMAGDDLELAERGNVWALYNDPSKLVFESSEDELRFWTQDGISRRTFGDERQGLELVYNLFAKGHFDLVKPSDFYNTPRGSPVWYEGFTLREYFAEHRERVRALTKRMWENNLEPAI